MNEMYNEYVRRLVEWQRVLGVITYMERVIEIYGENVLACIEDDTETHIKYYSGFITFPVQGGKIYDHYEIDW